MPRQPHDEREDNGTPRLGADDGYNSREWRKIQILRRRLAHVERRSGGSLDGAEAAALRWVLETVLGVDPRLPRPPEIYVRPAMPSPNRTTADPDVRVIR